MGIYYSEFDEMYSYLEKDPLTLADAVQKWKHIKDTGKIEIKKWKELLEERVIELIDDNYSVGTDMIKVWNDFYGSITEDSERGYFCILDLRNSFFNETLDILEAYEDSLIDKNDRYPCKNCGWFVWDNRNQTGYCNNFSLKRNLNSRCISEEE